MIPTRFNTMMAGALAGMLLLAGCVEPTGGAGFIAPSSRQAVLGRAVTIAAPRGYCVEPGSLREGEDTAILLLGRCTSSAAPAVLIATVGGAGSALGFDIAGGGTELAAFFQSDKGRAALSRSGRASHVQVLEAIGGSDAFLLRFSDSSPQGQGASVQAESWRAVLPLRGRLVTLTVTGLSTAPLDRDAGHALISGFARATAAANRPASL